MCISLDIPIKLKGGHWVSWPSRQDGDRRKSEVRRLFIQLVPCKEDTNAMGRDAIRYDGMWCDAPQDLIPTWTHRYLSWVSDEKELRIGNLWKDIFQTHSIWSAFKGSCAHQSQRVKSAGVLCLQDIKQASRCCYSHELYFIHRN